jgi:fido (protein-threonine AMPylation protein)
LEGNTYSLLETEQLLQVGRSDDTQLSSEAVMLLNHKAAIEFLLESALEADFDRRTILNLHALLTADLLTDPAAEGALRSNPVGIGKSSYLPPAIPALIETLFDTILAKAREIQDPFEQAFFEMAHLPYLQPFIDGNKRVSRLAANIPLFRRNLAPLSFVDVPEADYTDGMLAIYELNDVCGFGVSHIQLIIGSKGRQPATVARERRPAPRCGLPRHGAWRPVGGSRAGRRRSSMLCGNRRGSGHSRWGACLPGC